MIISKEEEAQQETLPPYSTHSEQIQASNTAFPVGDVQVRPVLVNPTDLRTEETRASSSKATPNLFQLEPYPTHLKPTNTVREYRKKGSITGQYVIDTSSSGETPGTPLSQPTVHLETGDGNINAKIWLVGGDLNSPSSACGRSPLFIVDCVNGFINLDIIIDCNIRSFTLKASCKNGGVSVSVPTSFVGPLTLHTRNAWAKFYPVLFRDITTFTDVEGDKKCFVGDFPSSGFGDGPWQGSSMDITCENGRIKLFYEHEKYRSKSQKNPLVFLQQEAGYNQRPIMSPQGFPYSQT